MFLRQVAETLRCDLERAEGLTLAVFHELRDRLTDKEAHDVAAQLPPRLGRLWAESTSDPEAKKVRTKSEFVGRVRHFAGLPDDREAELAVRAVFQTLQRLLGSPDGMHGEAWDVFSVLPKELKMLWLAAGDA